MDQHNSTQNKHISPVSVGFALLCGIVATWMVSLLMILGTTNKMGEEKLHKKAAVRHSGEAQEQTLKTPMHEQDRVYATQHPQGKTPYEIHSDAVRLMQNDVAMYKERVRLAKPYRGEMVERWRYRADHPKDDDMQLSHEQVNGFVEKGIYFE